MRARFFVTCIATLIIFPLWHCAPKPSPALGAANSGSTSTKLAALAQIRDHTYSLFWPAAHRGGIDSGVENSRQAIQTTLAAGLPLLEIDVRLSNDGELFLFHDRTLKENNFFLPKEFGGREIERLTSAERARVILDSTSQQKILSFSEVLELVRETKGALLIHLKGEANALIDAIVADIYSRRAESHAIMQFAKDETFNYARRRYPNIATLKACHSPIEIQSALQSGADIIELTSLDLIKSALPAARSKARILYDVSGSQFDTESDWKRLFESGIDIIMTNAPKKLRVLGLSLAPQ